MAKQILVKLSSAGFTKVQVPWIKLAAGWTKPVKVYTKTDAATWQEVWPGVIYYTFTGTGYNLNVAALFGNPTQQSQYVFTNNGTIGSHDTSLPALDTGALPAGSKLTIINNGRIQGMGGAGGEFNADTTAILAGNGGPALKATMACELQNNGQVYGGGGGGGGAAEYGGSNDNNAPGGGGAGTDGGITNRGTWRPGFYYAANAGTADAGGTNPSWPSDGAGGGPGLAGQVFTSNVGTSSNYHTPPGNAGAAVINSSTVSITITGDIRGAMA